MRDKLSPSHGARRRPSRPALAAATGLAVALALTACASGSGPASGGPSGAQGWEPARDIEWIVPYSPGGGFDIYSRGVAQVLQETQLPGGTHVVVRNNPPDPEGITRLYNAKPDGQTIGILPMPTAIGYELQNPELAKWTTADFTVLGSVDENAYVVYVAADSPYQSIEDLVDKKTTRVVTMAQGSSSDLALQATIDQLGLDSTVTYGAEGSAEIVTSLIRGDADFIVYGSTDLVSFVESGDIRPLLFLGTEEQRSDAADWLQDVPGAEQAGYPDLAGVVTELRLVVAPPGLPDDVADYLRDAVHEAITSQEFTDWAEKANRPIVPRDWESATEVMDRQIDAMTELLS